MVKPTILPDANRNQVTQLAKLPSYFLSTQGVLFLIPRKWWVISPEENCDINSSLIILFRDDCNSSYSEEFSWVKISSTSMSSSFFASTSLSRIRYNDLWQSVSNYVKQTLLQQNYDIENCQHHFILTSAQLQGLRRHSYCSPKTHPHPFLIQLFLDMGQLVKISYMSEWVWSNTWTNTLLLELG